MRILEPYYYGKHKWDNYLLDIQETIESGNAAGRWGTRLQSEALGVAHEHVKEQRQQTEQLRHIDQTLQSGLEELSAEFEWGFTLMVDRADRQINLLSQVAKELDAIHQTLRSPLINQAQELFRLGEQHFNEGLWDRALRDFLDSEQKNEVHPLLQLQIGKLFIYGCNDSYNLVDLPEAERHLRLAARYAEAKRKTLSMWSEICGQAYFHSGVAAYLIGEQEQAAGHPESMRSCLERALGYLAKAAVLWPRFTEIVYTEAKCHALLGQIQDAAHKLEVLSDRDRRYYAKASQDGDFKPLRASVEEVFKRATTSPGPLTRATQARIDEVAEAVAWARRSASTSLEDSTAIELFERELASARQSLATLDVDIEDLSERLCQMRAELEKLAQRSFQNNADSSQERLSSLEARQRDCERSIQSLKKTMATTSGAFGCVAFAVSSFVVLISIANGVLTPGQLAIIEKDYRGSEVIFTLLTAIIAGIVGSKLQRHFRNQPHQRQLEEYARGIGECVKTLPELRERVEMWKQQMRGFATWQAQRPSPHSMPPSAARGSSAGQMTDRSL